MGAIMYATSENTAEEYGGTTVDNEWKLAEVVTTTGGITLPSDFKEFMLEIELQDGIFSIIIPKSVFDRRRVGVSWYLPGWYYNASTNAYCFLTKRSSTEFTTNAFINGVAQTPIERVLWYR